MLGAVSFLRHIGSLWRSRGHSAASAGAPFFFSAELWTLFAVGSGIVLAYPQINLVLHGTYAIVGHSMGSMVGVNAMIILGALISRRADELTGVGPTPLDLAQTTRRLAGRFNLLLALIVADLFLAGLVKGLIRFEGDHHAYQPAVRWILVPLPLPGLLLTITLVRTCGLVFVPAPGSRRNAAGAVPA